MTEAIRQTVAVPRKDKPFIDALKDAAIAGFLAFVLFATLIGFKTETGPGGIVLSYRFQNAFWLAVGVMAVRLLFDLVVWRRLIKPEEIARRLRLTQGNVGTLGILLALYALGALFFVLPGVREAFIEGAMSLLVWLPGGRSEQLRTLITLISFGFMIVFLVGTAIILVKLMRAAASALTGGQPGPSELSTPLAGRMDEALSRPGGLGLWRDFGPALLLIAVVLPLLVIGPQQRYAIDTAIQVLTYIMLGWGLNIVVGLAGLLDLGYVAFYAVGAYTFALIATQFGLSFWVCLPIAGAFAALWGVMLGYPVLRLRGDYLAIVTLAFGEIIRVVLLNWYTLTNGPDGISRIPRITFFGIEFDRFSENSFHNYFGLKFDPNHRVIFTYYVILALAMFTHFVATRLRRLPIGRAWEALREDEIACRTLGINTVTTKLTAFGIGAMFGGIAGAFFATRQGFISPESFSFQESALILAIVVLGGLGSQIGVVIAAVVLIGSSEFFRDLEQYRMLIFGACMVTIMVWRPRGLISTRMPTIALKERRGIAAEAVSQGRG